MEKYARFTILFGCFFFLMATVMRYVFQPDSSKKILISILKSLFVADVRKNYNQAFGLILQITGLLWIVFGNLYTRFFVHVKIPNELLGGVKLVIGFGPPMIMLGLFKLVFGKCSQNK